MTLRRYLVLGLVTLTSAFGDTLLAVGMKRVGPVSLSHPDALISALRTPWVLGGVLLLLVFFASYLDGAFLGRPDVRAARHFAGLRCGCVPLQVLAA